MTKLNYFQVYEEYEVQEHAWNHERTYVIGKCFVTVLQTPSIQEMKVLEGVLGHSLSLVGEPVRFHKPPWSYDVTLQKSNVVQLILRHSMATHFQDQNFDEIQKLEALFEKEKLSVTDFGGRNLNLLAPPFDLHSLQSSSSKRLRELVYLSSNADDFFKPT